jgi:formylglycine-generating enzyme required for sulfatase activity
MAEPPEPKRPAPPGTPGAPLPRLWKVEPEDDAEDDEAPARKTKSKSEPAPGPEPARARKKRKPDDKAGKAGSKTSKGKGEGDGGKGVLVEETPNLDTYETRQRIRIAAGAAGVVVLLFVGWLVVRAFSPERPAEDAASRETLAAAPTPADTKAHDDQESRILLDRARDVAKNGKADLAVELLKKVAARYPNTPAANESREALDRPKQNLPLFLDRPAVVASPSPPPPAPPENPPTQVVEATRTAVSPSTGAQANLTPPANPAEPPRGPAPEASPGQEKPSKPLPAGFRPRPGSEVHPSGWPLEIVGDRDGAPMVLVMGGTFIQGRDDADPSEAPAHKVVLGTYYIDKHEVTVRQFNLFQKEAGRRAERAKALARDPGLSAVDAEEDRPVGLVTAREASDYCYWAGKRLPTEAQWEAAARTPDGRIYPWGAEPPNWPRPRAPRQIDPVMSFPNDLSPYGAFDLAGNAWEWTKDWYDPRYYILFRTNPADNPTGPPNRPRSAQLVVKGSAKDWVVTKREGIKPETRYSYLGFRGVLQVEGSGNAFEPPPAPGAGPSRGGQAGAGAVVPF